jgi:hypothetical protein
MSVKVVAELHPIRRTRVKITTNPKSIAEIIEDLNTGFPLTQARVCRNGEIVKDFSTKANDGDELAIKFVPYGNTHDQGVGMKIGGWAMFAVGLVLTLTGVGALVGVALMGSGLAMALGGQVLLSINIPSLKDREKPENDPSIRGGKNQARPHGRIPVLFGKHRLYPDIAANSHTSIIDGKQYYTQLFCGGYKDCVIDKNSFKLGETLLVELSATKNIELILSGADPVIRLEILQNGKASNLYPHCVHEDSINSPIQNQVDGADGAKISGEYIRTTPDNTDAIDVDIFFHNGLGKYNDDGDLESSSVEVIASYKPFDAPDSAYTSLGFFNAGSNTMSGAELKTKRFHVTKSGLIKGKYTVKIKRITADSTDQKIIDTVYLGSIRSFKSVAPIRAERRKDLTIIALRVLATSQLNGVLDSFNFIATAKMPVYSGGGSGSLYWLNAEETCNPASALLYALQGRAAQQIVDNNDINWESLEAFYNWCEQKDEDGDYKYTCNAYLSESVTIAELMRMIGSTARADILRIDSKISIVQDIERPSHLQLFTPKNSVSYSIVMFKADIPDAIAMRFIDEQAGYAQQELNVFNTPDGNRIKDPETIQKADLWGVTSSKQARRIGMYNYACLKNRPFVHTIETDFEYLICNKGDWIQYAGDIALAGSVQGRIKGVIFVDGVCIGIDTDEPVVMMHGKQHAVRIRLSNGTIILKDVVFNLGIPREKSIPQHPGEPYEPLIDELRAIGEDNVYYEPQNVIYFIEPFEKKDAPKAGDIYAFGVRGYEALDLIITDIQPGQNLTAVLTCVEYSPEIFGVDKPDFILPNFENKITPVSGAVDPGTVTPDRWRSFAVYHDSEDEPPRPSGDGQEDGWHHIQTFRSVWQSTKMAESIESGEWSLPVRIKAYRGNDDVTPIWLSLSPQNITLETDSDGNLLVGSLPLTVQARLFRWNSIITEAIFSLPDAPEGFSIDSNGVITVEDTSVLDEINNIIILAEYQSRPYTATLIIEKSINNFAPRYLGTINELSKNESTVTIIKGPITGYVRARQGDYVLAIAPTGERLPGSVFQWNGVSWQYRAPENFSALYINCFKDGLDVPSLSQDSGWFGSVFAKLLIAQEAFIENLAARMIQLQDNGGIRSENFLEGKQGFSLQANGRAVFNEELYVYNLKVVSFELIPPSGNRELIIELVGYDSQSLELSIGWYEIEMAGGGGGDGEFYSYGAEGGALTYRFYNNSNNNYTRLFCGGGGESKQNGAGGGGGGGSVVDVVKDNLVIIAGGGGGAHGAIGVSFAGGGGGGGGYGAGGKGGNSNNNTGGAGGGGGGGSDKGVGGNGSNGIYSGESTGGVGGSNGVGGIGGSKGKGAGTPATKGGTSINGFVTRDVGGGGNAHGGDGYLRLYKIT